MARPHARIHIAIVKPVAVAALGLRAIEREIGIAHELIDFAAIVGRLRDADAGADHHLLPVDFISRADGLEQPRRDLQRRVAAAADHMDDGKFVAAEASDKIAFADAAAQPFGDDDKQSIAARMTERIVDRLEAIEVEQKNRKALAGLV